MSKRAATGDTNNERYGRSKRTRGVEEKEDGAETGSELMAFLFKTLDQKNVDYVDNVNAFLVELLHKV